eukprot:TRINITY_DN121983_c0_g1_i1.p1 TRINITY_DN121983_c0_g1~~TRINITY_DN121983_c0_g1_i1.p1  ORF type:complete len:100 (-),score=16.21 TRINITY_DN121983_c0_g1_i1:98-397(-)
MKGKPEVEYANFRNHPPPLRPPKIPLKELVLSVSLFVVGTILLLCGANTFFKVSLSEAMPLNILGSLCFIPGSYHSFIFFMAFRRVPGYSYDMISVYND